MSRPDFDPRAEETETLEEPHPQDTNISVRRWGL